MRDDIRLQVEEESADEREKCQARRARVLAHPDIAADLLKPPFSASNPLFWSGYIPPAYHMGKHNDSPIRKQLIAICNKVAEREGTDGNVTSGPELITEPQLTKLHICLEECGYLERPDKLYYLSAFTGHDVASSKDLTLQEAGRIITVLSDIALEEARKEADAANQPDSEPEGSEPAGPDDRPAGTVPMGGTGEDADMVEGSGPEPGPETGGDLDGDERSELGIGLTEGPGGGDADGDPPY